jgi:hypothetical protein
MLSQKAMETTSRIIVRSKASPEPLSPTSQVEIGKTVKAYVHVLDFYKKAFSWPSTSWT